MSANLRNITNHQILEFFVILGGCLFAMYAGNYIADENFIPILSVLGTLFLIMVFFGLGSSIYVLIPICWGLTGQITALPLPFSVRQLVIMLAGVLFISALIFKTSNTAKMKYEPIDFWIWVNLFYLFTVFLHNPVGVAAISGSDRVGGKPYLDVLLAMLAYLMLARFKIPLKIVQRLPIWILCISFLTTAIGLFAIFAPGISVKLAPIYNGFDPMGVGGSVDATVTTGETRLIVLDAAGSTLILFIVCKIVSTASRTSIPLRWIISYVSGLIMILLSGFRTGVINAYIVTVIAFIIRERASGFLKVTALSLLMMLGFVLLSFSGVSLPYTFERAFSFLPGNWSEDAVMSATDSTQWRLEMWKIVITSNKYIRDKVFGDGFGFLRADFETMQAISYGQISGFEGSNPQQEAFMLSGDFHSGPLSAVRFVGVVGLALFLPLLVMIAFYAYRFIQRAEGTPFYMCTLFICIPILMVPFSFIFIIGDYRSDLVGVLFDVGMIKMLSASLDNYLMERNALLQKQPLPANAPLLVAAS